MKRSTRKQTSLSLLLAAALALTLLSGCGSSPASGAGEGPAQPYTGNTAGAGTLGPDSGDDTLLLLTTDNQWVLTRAEAEADQAVLMDSVYVGKDTLSGQFAQPEYVPNLRVNFDTMVWFGPDGKDIFFLSDVDAGAGTASLYRLDRTALAKDLSNARQCVSLVSQDVLPSFSNQLADGALLFRRSDNSLCRWDGEALTVLARDVDIPRGYGGETVPALGAPAFSLLDDGKLVAYTVREEDNSLTLCVRPVDGSGEETVLARGVSRYFCDTRSQLVFCETADGDWGKRVWAASPDGELQALTQDSGSLLSAAGDTAYFLQTAEDASRLCLYDGGETRVLCDDVNLSYVYGSAADQVALYADREDGQWYCAADGGEGVPFSFADDLSQLRYCGRSPDGQFVALWETDADSRRLMVLSLSKGAVIRADCVGEDVGAVRLRDDGSLCFTANAVTPDEHPGTVLSDLMVYRDGETVCLAEDIESYNTNQYGDDVVLSLSSLEDGTLVRIEDGKQTDIAHEADYFLRVGDGSVLYLSEQALYLDDGTGRVRLSDSALMLYCASGAYNTGAARITYPAFFPA